MTENSQLKAKNVTPDSSVMLEAARGYLSEGLAVLPLRDPLGHERRRGKAPFFDDWSELPMPTDRDLVSWFGGSCYNVGIRCGLISQLVVIDIDGWGGKQRFVDAIPSFGESFERKFRNTRKTKTGSGGFHILFRFSTSEFPEGVKSVPLWKGRGDHEGVELLGDGRVVVAPPSIHPDTKKAYESNNQPIEVITKPDYLQLLAAFGKAPTRRYAGATMAVPKQRNALSEAELQTALEMWLPYYTKGIRHDLMLPIAGISRKHGMPQESMERLALMLCKATGDTEIEDRLREVRDAYARDIRLPIAGRQMLRELLGL